MNEKKIMFPTSPHKFPFFISPSFLTNLAKSPKLITTAAKYPTIIENTARKAANDPNPSKPPERAPPENIFLPSDQTSPPAFAEIDRINTFITTLTAGPPKFKNLQTKSIPCQKKYTRNNETNIKDIHIIALMPKNSPPALAPVSDVSYKVTAVEAA